MKNVQKIDLGLTGYDELFANDEERKVNKLPRIFDIPISEIDDFPDHPFKVKIDEDMDQLVQSIKERGIRIKYEDARRFIPDSVPYNKTGEYIMKALEYYHRVQERQKDRGEAR